MASSEPSSAKPPKRRRRGEDRSELPLTSFLPERNPAAARAYVCALLGLIPVAGILLGPVALLFGWIGWRRYRANPDILGGGHALTGLILGPLELLVQLLGLALIAKGVTG